MAEQVVRSVKDLGSALLVGLCQLTVPRDPPAKHSCPYGETARFQRLRPATYRTLLGPIALQRRYYLCPTYHQGVAPLDHPLAFCSGSRSCR